MQPTPQDDRADGPVGAGTHADETAVAAAVLDLAELDGLAERPPHEHAAVYEQLHAQLQSALSEIDDA